MPERKNTIRQRIFRLIRNSSIRPATIFQRNTLADTGNAATGTEVSVGPVSEFLRQLGRLGLLFGRTLKLLFTARCDARESWRMAYRFTNGSVAFVMISMAFVGMIMVYQSTEQLARAVGDTTLVGASFLKLLVRVLGPTVIGLLLACRVGAGIAAEIGAMSVTDQLDAMRMCAADPIETLMVPRLRAGIVASFCLVIIGSFTSAIAGLATGMLLYGTAPTTYFNFSLILPSDVAQGMAKALSYGVAVPVVSGTFGLFARGGARGVGQATTAAVVGSSFAIVLLDSLISMAAHVLERL